MRLGPLIPILALGLWMEPALGGILLPGDPGGEWVRLRLAEAGADALNQPAPTTTRVWECRSGWSSPGAWLEGGGAVRLQEGLWAQVWVAATSDPAGESLLGSNTSRGGWTGRVLHGTLLYERPTFQLEWGRRNPGAGLDQLSDLTWPSSLPPVDMFRLRLHARDERLSLELAGARLESMEDPELRRWFARHRLSWNPGGRPNLRFTVGDQVLFTGRQRGFDWQYLNPLLPFFLENFEGYSEADHQEGTDQDNSSLFATWDAWSQLTDRTRLGCYGEILVDEFQLDAADRRRLDDALGLTLGLDARHALTARRVLRLRWEGSALSSWTYLHRGDETSYLEKGQVIGNAEGGDVLKHQLRLQLYRKSQADWQLSLGAGQVYKGAVEPTTPWDALSPGEWPLRPLTRTWTFHLSGLARLGPVWSLAVAAGRRTDEPGWSLQGRLACSPTRGGGQR